MLDDSDPPSPAEPLEHPSSSGVSESAPVPPSSSTPFNFNFNTDFISGENRFQNPPRRSGRLAEFKRSHSVADLGFRVSKRGRGRSFEAPEPERLKVRVVEPLMVEEIKKELAAKMDVIDALERTVRSRDNDQTRAALLNRRLEDQVEVLQKRQAELEETNMETLRTLEYVKNAHRLEIEARQADYIEEMSVKTSLDPSTSGENSAIYKALETRFQTVSKDLATTERRLNEVEEKLMARDAEIREHRSHRDRLLEEQSVLEAELADSRSTQEASNKMRQDTVAQLDIQIKQHQETKEDLRLTKENITNLIRSLHTTEQTLESCRRSEHQHKETVDELNRVIESKDTELARAVSLKDSLQEDMERSSRLLEQRKIALEAQERRQGDLEASRRELALANIKVSELSHKVDELQHSANDVHNNHRSELRVLNERLSESKIRVDEAIHKMNVQRKEMLGEKNQALEVEREAVKVKDRLLQEVHTTAEKTREENQRLQARIDALELENKRLGKLPAAGPADTETVNPLGITRKPATRRRVYPGSSSIFTAMISPTQEPDVSRVDIIGGDSDHDDLPRQRSSSRPALTEPRLASPFRQTTPSRQPSPEIAAPGTYHFIANPKRNTQGTSSGHLATPVGRYRQSLSPEPSSSGPSKLQNPTPQGLSNAAALRSFSHSPEPTTPSRSTRMGVRSQESNKYAASGLRESNAATSWPCNDSRDDDIPETPSQMEAMLMRTLLKLTQRSKKPQYMVTPFKNEAPSRPRTPQQNFMMAGSRKLLFELLDISSDAQIAMLDRSHCADAESVEEFENGRSSGPHLVPLAIYWETVKCKWNTYLAKLFALRLVREVPALKGQEDEISEHFMRRIQTLRSVFSRGLPREGETEQQSRARRSGEHERELHEKRIRRRQIELGHRRFKDCDAGRTSEDEELAKMVNLLGDDGMSSDESDGYGNRLVRDKPWRNRAIINRMARADSKHPTTGVYGNRRPGSQLQRRIRRHNGPVSEKKIPAGKPINYYDTALYHSLSPEERLQLDPQRAVPFRGEHDPVDESLFD